MALTVRSQHENEGQNDADEDEDEVDAGGFREERSVMTPLELIPVQ